MKKFNTEEERRAFKCGVDYTTDYIKFCIINYTDDLFTKDHRELTLRTFDFQLKLVDFIQKKGYIPNRYNISFKDFCDDYERYRLK